MTSQPAESSMLSSSTLLDFPVTRSVNLQGIVSSAFWLYWPEEIKAKMTRNNCQVECKRLGTVIGSSAKGGDLTFPLVTCKLFFMPELPEVETIARGLAKRVNGDVIESVWLGSKPEPLKSPAAEIAGTLESSRIVDVRRVGKHIVFDLESGARRQFKKSKSEKKKSVISSKSGRGRPLHIYTSNSAVDCASGDDWAHAGLRR